MLKKISDLVEDYKGMIQDAKFLAVTAVIVSVFAFAYFVAVVLLFKLIGFDIE